jgi:hypothetical protein
MKKLNDLLFVFIALSICCTENPFNDDEIDPSFHQLTGTVKINDGSQLVSIYVWLEGFDIGTYTDPEGQFLIKLPSSTNQIGGTNLSGTVNLYYFVANFKLGSSKVTLSHGRVVDFEGDFDKNGELDKPIILEQIVAVKTSITPSSIPLSSNKAVTIKITLEAFTQNVPVYFPGQIEGINFPLLLKMSQSNNIIIMESILKVSHIGPFNEDNITVNKTYSRELELYIGAKSALLSEGEYEVIPYLLVNYDPVPINLLKSLGVTAIPSITDYVKIPFKREGGKLTLTK